MGLWLDVVRVAAVVNVALLVGLCAVWVRNARQFRTKHTLGLLIFGGLLLLENGMAVYYFVVDPFLSSWFASDMPATPGTAMMTMRVVESLGLVFLTWITMD